MKILITGGAGFVGSNVALYLKSHYPHYEVHVMDNLKRRGSELNLSRLKDAGIVFNHGDIRVKSDFDSFDSDFNIVLDASAEPSVLAGIGETPDYLVETNLNGTIHCLYFANKCNAGFIFLSTSRIYPIDKIDAIRYTEAGTRFEIASNQLLSGITKKGISELFPITGYRSFYGATKLASELMVTEFNAFYGLRTVINRCGVITGPWQMGKLDQGVVALWLTQHYWKGSLSYIGFGGEGKQVRDVLHVEDLSRLIDYQIHHLDDLNGKILNVGGGDQVSLSLTELTMLCQEITGNKISISQKKENRKADIRLYITDNTQITALTGWKPVKTPKLILEDIYAWIQSNESLLRPIFSIP
jgi:CDP-paratose 2-epimerase